MQKTYKLYFKVISIFISLSLFVTTLGSEIPGISQDSVKKYVSDNCVYAASQLIPEIPTYASSTSQKINVLQKPDTYENIISSNKSPLEIYNYIRTHLSSDIGISYRRDKESVLKTGRATASENAALLISMLRDMGYEAKYVHGRAVLSEKQSKWMTGASSIDKAADVYKENGIKVIRLKK